MCSCSVIIPISRISDMIDVKVANGVKLNSKSSWFLQTKRRYCPRLVLVDRPAGRQLVHGPPDLVVFQRLTVLHATRWTVSYLTEGNSSGPTAVPLASNNCHPTTDPPSTNSDGYLETVEYDKLWMPPSIRIDVI